MRQPRPLASWAVLLAAVIWINLTGSLPGTLNNLAAADFNWRRSSGQGIGLVEENLPATRGFRIAPARAY